MKTLKWIFLFTFLHHPSTVRSSTLSKCEKLEFTGPVVCVHVYTDSINWHQANSECVLAEISHERIQQIVHALLHENFPSDGDRKYWINFKDGHNDTCRVMYPGIGEPNTYPCNQTASGYVCQDEQGLFPDGDDGHSVESRTASDIVKLSSFNCSFPERILFDQPNTDKNVIESDCEEITTEERKVKLNSSLSSISWYLGSREFSKSNFTGERQKRYPRHLVDTVMEMLKEIAVYLKPEEEFCLEHRDVVFHVNHFSPDDPNLTDPTRDIFMPTGALAFKQVTDASSVTVIEAKFPLLKEETVHETTYKSVVSRVLSYSVLLDGQTVSVPVEFKLQTKGVDITGPNSNLTHSWEFQCGFMTERTRKKDSDGSYGWGWSTEGCSVKAIQESFVVCQCFHTTNFAILMQVVPIKIPELHSKALSIITYAGCGVSITGLLLTLGVFVVLRLYSQDRTFIHINLAINLLLLQIVFLAGASQVDAGELCTAVALILHYLALATFSWMLVEGIQLYLQVVKVFGTFNSRKIVFGLIGYLLPAVVVLLSAVVFWEGYSESNRSSCWLSMQKGFHWSFIGPASLIIAVNMIITGMVLRIVVRAALVDKEASSARVAAKGLVVLAPITGLGWSFALMAVSEDTIVFQYLFAIFNSLQGLCIFLFHCVFNCEVRSAWNLRKARRAAKRKITSTSTPSNDVVFSKDTLSRSYTIGSGLGLTLETSDPDDLFIQSPPALHVGGKHRYMDGIRTAWTVD